MYINMEILKTQYWIKTHTYTPPNHKHTHTPKNQTNPQKVHSATAVLRSVLCGYPLLVATKKVKEIERIKGPLVIYNFLLILKKKTHEVKKNKNASI